MLIFLAISAVFLAYANGANDNFKGVATLFGTGTTDYRTALWVATAATFLGAVLSVVLAESLVTRFTGKGVVPDLIAASPDFLVAIAVGAGLAVTVATFLGLPISTTHGLTGALVGAAIVSAGGDVNLGALGKNFFLPLLVSPFLALVIAAILYRVFRYWRLRMGVDHETVAVVTTNAGALGDGDTAALALGTRPWSRVELETTGTIRKRYSGTVLGVGSQNALDAAHVFSAGVVSFARGLNDTPKIVALLVAIQALQIEYGMVAVAVAMAIGGVLSARRVAHTMSRRITPMNHGQGFTANLVTGALVIFASRLGVPVSTTHVSVGSLFGIAASTRRGNPGVISAIVVSWVLTLPVAAIFAAATYWVVHS